MLTAFGGLSLSFVECITLEVHAYFTYAVVMCCEQQETLSLHLQESLSASKGPVGVPAGRAADQVKANSPTAHMQAAPPHSQPHGMLNEFHQWFVNR